MAACRGRQAVGKSGGDRAPGRGHCNWRLPVRPQRYQSPPLTSLLRSDLRAPKGGTGHTRTRRGYAPRGLRCLQTISDMRLARSCCVGRRKSRLKSTRSVLDKRDYQQSQAIPPVESTIAPHASHEGLGTSVLGHTALAEGTIAPHGTQEGLGTFGPKSARSDHGQL